MAVMMVFTVASLCSCENHKDDPVSTIMGTTNDRELDKELFDDTGNTLELSGAVYRRYKTYPSQGIRNGRMSWRIHEVGGAFGSTCVFVFSDKRQYKVPNTKKNFRPGDGFVFKPGYKSKYTDKERDTSTSHGGVYLQANYGNRSKYVTVYKR